MPSVFYDNPATLVELNSTWMGFELISFEQPGQTSGPKSKTGKLSLSRRREHRSALIGIQWGASVPISSLACYPIPCLVSSPLYFTVLLFFSSNVGYLNYCFRYCYLISLLLFVIFMFFYIQFFIISCCYLFVSVSYCLLLLFLISLRFLLFVVVIRFSHLILIVCICYGALKAVLVPLLKCSIKTIC